MKKILQTIESALNDESPLPFWLDWTLGGLARAYQAAVDLRVWGFQRRLLTARKLPCLVISIGNLTAGGTGKTPMTQYVAELCRRLAYRTVVISRGYKGTAEGQGGGIVSDGRGLRMTAAQAGDEPFLLAGRLPDVPVLVGRDRFAAGLRAIREFQPDVIILDDGFQHLALQRDLDLVLLDYWRPLGNGRLLPRGPLREPLTALARAQGIIFTRWDQTAGPVSPLLAEALQDKPVFFAAHQPHVAAVVPARGPKSAAAPDRPHLAALGNRRVHLFSGIARNADFQRAAAEQGAEIKGHHCFSDHHRYSPADLQQIQSAAHAHKAELILTTEKDFSRLGHENPFALELWVLGVSMDFGRAAESFERFIQSKLSSDIHFQKVQIP